MKNLIVLFCLFFSLNGYGQNDPPEKFEKRTIKINKVPYDIYKGAVQVKLDRSDSSSTYISIPVHIIKSSSRSPSEPVYWMAGGPGETNLKFTPSLELLANHDFVLAGYRGVDGPVMPESRKLKKALRGLNHHLLSDESLDNLGLTVKQYFTGLAGKGIDVNHYTILDVVDDFEDIRRKLGHQKINLYSGSYGTRVALLYSYRYPESIKRSLMFGVNPPGHCIWYPEMTTRIIQRYDSINKVQSGSGNISIEENIKQSFKKMPERWSLFKLDADKIKMGTFCLMFSKSTAVMAFDAYMRASLKDDYSGLYMIQLASDYIGLFTSELNYGDMFSKAYSADYDPNVDYRRLFRPGTLEIGAPLSALYWGCGTNWSGKLIGSQYRDLGFCETETLMVGGNLDNANPPEITIKELAPYLPNGKQVILTHMAHTGDMRFLQYDAFNFMSCRYFDEGVVDTSRFKHDPIDFIPKKNLNRMAKMYYPLVLILSIIR